MATVSDYLTEVQDTAQVLTRSQEFMGRLYSGWGPYFHWPVHEFLYTLTEHERGYKLTFQHVTASLKAEKDGPLSMLIEDRKLIEFSMDALANRMFQLWWNQWLEENTSIEPIY